MKCAQRHPKQKPFTYVMLLNVALNIWKMNFSYVTNHTIEYTLLVYKYLGCNKSTGIFRIFNAERCRWTFIVHVRCFSAYEFTNKLECHQTRTKIPPKLHPKQSSSAESILTLIEFRNENLYLFDWYWIFSDVRVPNATQIAESF